MYFVVVDENVLRFHVDLVWEFHGEIPFDDKIVCVMT